MMESGRNVRRRWRNAAILSASALFLSACDTQDSGLFNRQQQPDEQATLNDSPKAQSETRDVEAPEVFQKTEMGLWDGRPSFGGQWVAHPDVEDPERVIILNTATSESVIGALFKRERETSGPRFQVSSDAAEALGMLAGAPTQLTVTALRREEISTKETEPMPDDEIEDTE